MIYLDASIGEVKNVTVLEFGKGDIHMYLGANSKEGRVDLYFKNGEVEEIGVGQAHEHMTIEELNPQIVMLFKKVESIDALITRLNEAKEMFISNKNKEKQ